MRTLASLLGLTLALAAATAIAGWWTVPVVAALWTVLLPRPGAALYAAIAGVFAWGALLLWSAQSAPIGALDILLTKILGVPAGGPIVLTLAYAGLLAGSAAMVAQAIGSRARAGATAAASMRSR